MKNFLNKIRHSAWLAPLFFIGTTQFAHADGWFSFSDIAFSIFAKGAYAISYLIGWIAGVYVAIISWFISVVIQLNMQIFNTVLVQKGFSLSLSVANLGFVLGIIIIALATILQIESYGAKKILWKLVIGAILVNFSLVIAAPIFGLGNSFATYFLNCMNNKQCDGSAGVGVTADSFATSLAGAFQPQNGFDIHGPLIDKTGFPTDSALSQDFGAATKPVFSVFFAAIESVVIVITLATLAVMLLIRYVYIAILAILMPFAWLGWVFPSMGSWWSKWWNNFIRWTFFAPIVLFFMYLAIQTTTAMNDPANGVQSYANYTDPAKNSMFAGIATFFGGALSGVIQNVLNVVIMTFLAVGGMIVADKLSIAGASAGMGAITGAGKAVQGSIGRYTKRKWDRAKTYPQRTERGRSLTASLQTAGAGRNGLVRGILKPVRGVGNIVANSRGAAEKMPSERQKELEKKSLEEQVLRYANQDPAGKLAIMMNLKKGMESKDKKIKEGALKAFNNLPANIQKDFDSKLSRLKVLYGKTGTTLENSKTKSAADKLEEKIKKAKEKGDDTTDDESLLESLRAAETEQTEAVKEEGVKNREEMKREGKENRKAYKAGQEPIQGEGFTMRSATPPNKNVFRGDTTKPSDDEDDASKDSTDPPKTV
jgi:hypothetical protein